MCICVCVCVVYVHVCVCVYVCVLEHTTHLLMVTSMSKVFDHHTVHITNSDGSVQRWLIQQESTFLNTLIRPVLVQPAQQAVSRYNHSQLYTYSIGHTPLVSWTHQCIYSNVLTAHGKILVNHTGKSYW